mmetsp:Transcript_11338/g.23229  ORF Transcript_11338/g.23229 Transcript_11338/m.23229 type:complete len:265 (+) Transcript_11338:226-1020(+)
MIEILLVAALQHNGSSHESHGSQDTRSLDGKSTRSSPDGRGGSGTHAHRRRCGHVCHGFIGHQGQDGNGHDHTVVAMGTAEYIAGKENVRSSVSFLYGIGSTGRCTNYDAISLIACVNWMNVHVMSSSPIERQRIAHTDSSNGWQRASIAGNLPDTGINGNFLPHINIHEHACVAMGQIKHVTRKGQIHARIASRDSVDGGRCGSHFNPIRDIASSTRMNPNIVNVGPVESDSITDLGGLGSERSTIRRDAPNVTANGQVGGVG